MSSNMKTRSEHTKAVTTTTTTIYTEENRLPLTTFPFQTPPYDALLTSTIRIPELEHPRRLLPRKHRITSIIRIIHVIMDIIQSGHIRATILTARTPTRSHPLRRRIAHRVPGPATTLSLKNMKQTEPVTDFVSRRATEIEVRGRAPRETVGEDVAAVGVEGGAARRGVGGEGTDS